MRREKTIVVLNHITNQVDLVSFPAGQEESTINSYLTGLKYDMEQCTFMLVNENNVRVNNFGSSDYAILGDLTPYDQKEKIKQVEQETLISRMQALGVEEYEIEKEERPIIAAYLGEEPGDFVVHEVQIYKGSITLSGHDKECWESDIIEVEVDDVFPGHLDYVIDCLK